MTEETRDERRPGGAGAYLLNGILVVGIITVYPSIADWMMGLADTSMDGWDNKSHVDLTANWFSRGLLTLLVVAIFAFLSHLGYERGVDKRGWIAIAGVLIIGLVIADPVLREGALFLLASLIGAIKGV